MIASESRGLILMTWIEINMEEMEVSLAVDLGIGQNFMSREQRLLLFEYRILISLIMMQ